jgi:TetR/AcrR family transcriptional repressor of nem operon
MRDAGLTHGGFYKHFADKNELLIESLEEGFLESSGRLAKAAARSEPASEWKAIVNAYLSPEHSDHPELGCPVAALAPELARADKTMKPRILLELDNYKTRLLPFMPGCRKADKERAYYAIFSTMIGAVAIARILADRKAKAAVLATAREFLLRSF